MNQTRRRLVAATLGSALKPDSHAAAANHGGQAAQRHFAVQIGNFGHGSARTDAAPEVVQLGEGMAACIAKANSMGGIRDRELAFAQVSDRNDPAVFIDQFRQANAQGAVAVLCPYGGAHVKRMLDEHVLDAIGPTVVGVVPGAEVFRSPGHPKLLHVRAGDGRQIANILKHARQLGIRHVAVLAIANDAGRSGISAAQAAVESDGAMDVKAFQAGADRASLRAAARALAASEAECAVVVGPPLFMADAVLALRSWSFRAFVYALSYLSPELLVSVAGAQATGVAISQVYPNPNGIVMPLQREFRAAMRVHFPSIGHYSAFHLEGYVCARVVLEGLRRAQTIDGQSLAWALRTANEIDLGGYPVDFSRGNGGSRYVDIAMAGADGRLRY